MRPDGLDMVHLEPPRRAAALAAKAVTLEGGHAQNLPARASRDPLRKAVMILPHAHVILDFGLGRAAIRAPWATARTVAAAASIRPVLRALASFRLFAGSRRQTAS